MEFEYFVNCRSNFGNWKDEDKLSKEKCILILEMCSSVEDIKGKRIKDFNKGKRIIFKKLKRLRLYDDW